VPKWGSAGAWRQECGFGGEGGHGINWPACFYIAVAGPLPGNVLIDAGRVCRWRKGGSGYGRGDLLLCWGEVKAGSL